MSTPNVDLLQGTLDLLILKALALGPLHGWAIAKRIQQMSRDVLTINQGSLYPALYRLQERGLIASEPGVSPEGRRITLYKPTTAGRKELAQRVRAWEAFAAAMRNVIRYA
jgi:PadR family transcriptional regulator PadR